MLSLGILSVISVGLILFWGVRVLVKAAISPLRSVPGPILARFTRLWYLRQLYGGHFEKTNIALHRKYGKIVRIAPNRYSIDDLDATKTIYGPGTHFRKSDWYYGWAHPDPRHFTIFTARDMTLHAAERRKYSAAYSMSTLVSYEPSVNNCVRILEQRLHEFASAEMQVNLGHWMQCYAFDVIGEITFSKRFGFLDAGSDIGGIISSLENKALYSTLVGVYAELHPAIFALLTYLRGSKATGDAYNREFASKAISERKVRPPSTMVVGADGPSDFLTKFLESHTSNPETFTNENVLVGCLTNVVAGSDTTSITLNSILYHLFTNPRCLSRLRDEIETLGKDGTISDPLTFKDSQKMPYLQAVIKEGLRMHPATGLPLERVVPKGGATIAGSFFPEGTIVGINTWVAHRSRIFSPDPNTFRPERWFARNAAEQENIQRMERYFMPFGLGSRTCLGKHISFLEINKVIPQIVRRFDIHIKEPLLKDDASLENGDDDDDVGRFATWKTSNRWFVKQVGFEAKIVLRKQAAV